MSLKIIVLAKQVPDTRNVGKDAMKEDGTINRAALPAIFNPEDLNALEQALRLKDAYPGTTVTLLTMGPGRAAEIIREGLYRGADGGYLLTDRAFAGADTLATSYALATAIKKIGDYDIIIGGRQRNHIPQPFAYYRTGIYYLVIFVLVNINICRSRYEIIVYDLYIRCGIIVVSPDIFNCFRKRIHICFFLLITISWLLPGKGFSDLICCFLNDSSFIFRKRII